MEQVRYVANTITKTVIMNQASIDRNKHIIIEYLEKTPDVTEESIINIEDRFNVIIDLRRR